MPGSGFGMPFRNGLFTKNGRWLTDGTLVQMERPLRSSDVRDGVSYTLMVAEKRLNLSLLGQPQFGDNWAYTDGVGPNTLRSGWLNPARDPRGPANIVYDQFGSSHSQGMNALFADGSVRSIRYDIADDLQVLPLWIPPLGMVGIQPLQSPPYPPYSLKVSLFQRLCHRDDGGTIAEGELE